MSDTHRRKKHTGDKEPIPIKKEEAGKESELKTLETELDAAIQEAISGVETELDSIREAVSKALTKARLPESDPMRLRLEQLLKQAEALSVSTKAAINEENQPGKEEPQEQAEAPLSAEEAASEEIEKEFRQLGVTQEVLAGVAGYSGLSQAHKRLVLKDLEHLAAGEVRRGAYERSTKRAAYGFKDDDTMLAKVGKGIAGGFKNFAVNFYGAKEYLSVKDEREAYQKFSQDTALQKELLGDLVERARGMVVDDEGNIDYTGGLVLKHEQLSKEKQKKVARFNELVELLSKEEAGSLRKEYDNLRVTICTYISDTFYGNRNPTAIAESLNRVYAADAIIASNQFIYERGNTMSRLEAARMEGAKGKLRRLGSGVRRFIISDRSASAGAGAALKLTAQAIGGVSTLGIAIGAGAILGGVRGAVRGAKSAEMEQELQMRSKGTTARERVKEREKQGEVVFSPRSVEEQIGAIDILLLQWNQRVWNDDETKFQEKCIGYHDRAERRVRYIEDLLKQKAIGFGDGAQAVRLQHELMENLAELKATVYITHFELNNKTEQLSAIQEKRLVKEERLKSLYPKLFEDINQRKGKKGKVIEGAAMGGVFGGMSGLIGHEVIGPLAHKLFHGVFGGDSGKLTKALHERPSGKLNAKTTTILQERPHSPPPLKGTSALHEEFNERHQRISYQPDEELSRIQVTGKKMEIPKDAIVGKGEGIINALKRQLMAEEPKLKGSEADKLAFKIAVKEGYVKIDEHGNLAEDVRVRPVDRIAYVLQKDAKGEFHITEIDTKAPVGTVPHPSGGEPNTYEYTHDYKGTPPVVAQKPGGGMPVPETAGAGKTVVIEEAGAEYEQPAELVYPQAGPSAQADKGAVVEAPPVQTSEAGGYTRLSGVPPIEHYDGSDYFVDDNVEFRRVPGTENVYEYNKLLPDAKPGAAGSSFKEGDLADGYVQLNPDKTVQTLKSYGSLDLHLTQDQKFLPDQLKNVPLSQRDYAYYQELDKALREIDRVVIEQDGRAMNCIIDGNDYRIAIPKGWHVSDQEALHSLEPRIAVNSPEGMKADGVLTVKDNQLVVVEQGSQNEVGGISGGEQLKGQGLRITAIDNTPVESPSRTVEVPIQGGKVTVKVGTGGGTSVQVEGKVSVTNEQLKDTVLADNYRREILWMKKIEVGQNKIYVAEVEAQQMYGELQAYEALVKQGDTATANVIRDTIEQRLNSLEKEFGRRVFDRQAIEQVFQGKGASAAEIPVDAKGAAPVKEQAARPAAESVPASTGAEAETPPVDAQVIELWKGINKPASMSWENAVRQYTEAVQGNKPVTPEVKDALGEWNKYFQNVLDTFKSQVTGKPLEFKNIATLGQQLAEQQQQGNLQGAKVLEDTFKTFETNLQTLAKNAPLPKAREGYEELLKAVHAMRGE